MTTTTYHHGRNSKIGREAKSARGFVWIFAKLVAGLELKSVDGAHSVELRHADRCARCARPLTVPASIDSGFGPDCAEKVGAEWVARVKGGEFLPLVFLLGGNATFTASSSKGGRFTYRVRLAKPRDGETNPPRRWFVAVLTGPDNSSDYTYLGTIVERNGGAA
jgi:hypothetical protein